MHTKKLLTIITPTRNSSIYISKLIHSINSQSDLNFNWLVIDSYSNDLTIEIIRKECRIDYKIIQSHDFSIYHALNIGIKSLNTIYYCVAGSDDFFSPDFVETINKIIYSEDTDLIFGSVIMKNRIISPRSNLSWLYGMHGVATCHSIGTVINSNLHKEYGNYSKFFPIVADQYFIKTCINNSARTIKANKVFGTYSTLGFSSTNKLHYQLDFFKMQLLTEPYKFIQVIIFLLRLFKLVFIHPFKQNNAAKTQ